MPVHTERAWANKLQRCSSKYRHQSDRVGGCSRVREAARFAVHTKCAARRAHVLRSAAQLCAFGVDVPLQSGARERIALALSVNDNRNYQDKSGKITIIV
ncbi:hypothetical protein J6590_108032 [Homalodisca vitripennis]|nr:hypothetical protein J6590_108032 [Homalodisca vitripennis]